MKKCTNCNQQFPDNFKKCGYCNSFLPEQPVPGSEQLELFMYDDDMGRRIHTGNSFNGITILMIIIASLSPLISIFAGMSMGMDIQAIVIPTAIVGTAIMVVFMVVALVNAYKKSVPRTSYIYYKGVLYKIMLWGGDIALRYRTNSRSLIRSIINLYGESQEIKSFEARCAQPETYLDLFFRYIGGEQVWNSISGGEGKIDALKDFRITGETERQYHYSYIDEKGRQKSGRLLKCYPDIETVLKRYF